MEGGNAIAGVLFGDVNPSGKLPCTFPRRLDDSPAHALHAYPGKNGTVRYEEGLLVGYRWFDTRTIEPLFPFGHGLSFTTFKYSNLALVNPATNGPAVIVQFEIANTGRREGAETAQVYVHHPQSRLTRPLKELKGFSKVNLKPGAKQVVSIPLNRSAFAFYDPDKRAWCAEAGEYKILVGSSSRDLRLDGTFKLGETIIEK
jgi:beta-glucosidase